MASRATFLESIELSSVPPAAVRDSPLSSPALSRKPSYESLAAAGYVPTLSATPTCEAREDQNTSLRRLSMSEPEDGREAQELPPVDRGKGCWGFVAAAFVLEAFVWGFSYVFASILVYFQTHEPWNQYSLAALSSIGTIQLALEFMLPLIVINGFRRYPDKVKLALIISAAVYSGSMLIASFATNVTHLVLLQGVLCGASGAVLYTPVLLFLNGWFVEKRGLASGIVFSGTGFGGLTFPFLIGNLLDKYGFAWMCRIWALVTAIVFAFAIVFIKPRVPLRKPAGPRPKWFMIDFKTINNPIVWTMAITTFVSSLAYFPVSLYLPSYTVSLLNSDDAFKPNLVVGIFNLAGMLGSNVTGYGSDLSLPWTVSALGVAGGVVALSAWGTATSLGKVFGFAVLYGFSSQICSCWGPAARDAAGANPQTSTAIFCIWGIMRGIASLVGPFVSTSLYNEEEAKTEGHAWGRFGFRKIIVFVGVMSFLSALGGVSLGYLRKRLAAAKQLGRSGA
ncbi:uncharacterized protein JCM15063_001181 [Sporobolomyces koalae]|uniref:uncharacterized protein n=1 Tax=Sporobolomyces koalae TaxID=500713 RepID=UPI00317639CD